VATRGGDEIALHINFCWNVCRGVLPEFRQYLWPAFFEFRDHEAGVSICIPEWMKEELGAANQNVIKLDHSSHLYIWKIIEEETMGAVKDNDGEKRI